jgi:hypothetical protein
MMISRHRLPVTWRAREVCCGNHRPDEAEEKTERRPYNRAQRRAQAKRNRR